VFFNIRSKKWASSDRLVTPIIIFCFSMALTPSPSAPIKIFDFSGNPPDPLPLGGEGGSILLRGASAPLKHPREQRGTERRSLQIPNWGVLEGAKPLFNSLLAPIILKKRGIGF